MAGHTGVGGGPARLGPSGWQAGGLVVGGEGSRLLRIGR